MGLWLRGVVLNRLVGSGWHRPWYICLLCRACRLFKTDLIVSFCNICARLIPIFSCVYTAMMRTIVFTLAGVTGVAAMGSAVVLNLSKRTIYVWAVGGSIGPRQTISPGEFNWYWHRCYSFELEDYALGRWKNGDGYGQKKMNCSSLVSKLCK